MVTESHPQASKTPEPASVREVMAMLNAPAPDTAADTSAARDPVRAHQVRVAALQLQALEFLVQFAEAHFESSPKEARLAATAVLKADLTAPPAPVKPRSNADRILQEFDDMLKAAQAAQALLAFPAKAGAEEEEDLDDDDDDDDGDDDSELPDQGDDDDEEADESEKDDDDPLGDDDGHETEDAAGRPGAPPSRLTPSPAASSS